jgi:hypothetical protein
MQTGKLLSTHAGRRGRPPAQLRSRKQTERSPVSTGTRMVSDGLSARTVKGPTLIFPALFRGLSRMFSSACVRVASRDSRPRKN